MSNEYDEAFDAAIERINGLADPDKRIQKAVLLLVRYGQVDGEHHKAWCIDQVVRILAGRQYKKLIQACKGGEDGPETYGWDRLIELADKRAAEKREQERVDQAKRDACARYGHGPFLRERCVMCGEGE